MGIKHRADSGLREFSALSKLVFVRTVKSFEMPYVSYLGPLDYIQNVTKRASIPKTAIQQKNKTQIRNWTL